VSFVVAAESDCVRVSGHTQGSLRLLLNAVAHAAARYQRSVVPLACFSIDFYVRIFVRIRDSASKAKDLGCTSGLVLQCAGCDCFRIVRMGTATEKGAQKIHKPGRMPSHGSQCLECESDSEWAIGGPMWMGPLYCPSFVESCLQLTKEDKREDSPGITSWAKVLGLLTALSEEPVDVPLFYTLPGLCSVVKLSCAPVSRFRAALRRLGYQAGHFHREPQAVKTDAPEKVVFDVLRTWAKAQPAPKVVHPILKHEIETPNIDLSEPDSSEAVIRVPMFLPNPERNWGPKRAATATSAGPSAKMPKLSVASNE